MSRTFLMLSLLSVSALFLSSCAPALDRSTAPPTATSVESPTAVTAVEADPTPTPSEEARPTPTPEPTPAVTLTAPAPDLGGIDPDEIVTLLPPNAIPAIWNPKSLWATVEEAEENGDITDGVDVIGVAMGGEARAYPIPFLSAHEIVNDTVGGTAIAVTW